MKSFRSFRAVVAGSAVVLATVVATPALAQQAPVGRMQPGATPAAPGGPVEAPIAAAPVGRAGAAPAAQGVQGPAAPGAEPVQGSALPALPEVDMSTYATELKEMREMQRERRRYDLRTDLEKSKNGYLEERLKSIGLQSEIDQANKGSAIQAGRLVTGPASGTPQQPLTPTGDSTTIVGLPGMSQPPARPADLQQASVPPASPGPAITSVTPVEPVVPPIMTAPEPVAMPSLPIQEPKSLDSSMMIPPTGGAAPLPGAHQSGPTMDAVETAKKPEKAEKKKEKPTEPPLPVVIQVLGTGQDIQATILVPYVGEMTVRPGSPLPNGLVVEVIAADGVIVSKGDKVIPLIFGDRVPRGS